MRTKLAGVSLVMWAVGGAAWAAPNDYEVQSAVNAPNLVKGQLFQRGARILVPANSTVTLLDRTGAVVATRECAGQYEGPVERCPRATARSPAQVPGGGRAEKPE